MIRLISWNVNGLRACVKKGFMESFAALEADIVCLQETKLQAGQIELTLPADYQDYWNFAEKKGYSGTAVFTRIAPLSVAYGIGNEAHDGEGRVITLEFSEFYLVTVYTPNSGQELKRLDYRKEWDTAFRLYAAGLDEKKPVVILGDLNVAHQEIDLKNPSTNRKSAGFTDQERTSFGELLDQGFIDSFRTLYPDQKGAYSWWSYRGGARERNAGWRIDYVLLSKRLQTKMQAAAIHPDIMGADHCPVGVDLEL